MNVLTLTFVLLFIVWFGMAIAVGHHASVHERGAFRWFIATLIFGLVGALLYVLLTDVDKETRTYRVHGTVEDEVSGDTTEYQLVVEKDTPETAADQFRADAIHEGYRVVGDPTVEVET